MFILFFLTFFLIFFLSYAIIYKHNTGISRLNNSFTIFFFILFFEFFLLISFRIYKPIFIFLFPLIIGIFFNFFHLSIKNFLKFFLRDLKVLIKIFKISEKIYLFIPIIIIFIRASLMPPLGWDALTCHLPKAVLWAQKGKFFFMGTPGGWNIFQTYFAGGSIIPSYVLVFFKNDIFLSFIDIFYFLLFILTVFLFLKELGIKKDYILSGVLFLLSLPTILLSLGSLYVDLLLSLFILRAIYYFFILKKKNNRLNLNHLFISIGIALSIKITILLSIFIIVAFSFFYYVKKIKRALIPLILFTLVFVPWIMFNIINTGYAFGFLPFKFFSIKFGQPTKALEFYMDRTEVKVSNFKDEFFSFFKIFGFPFKTSTNLSFFSIFPLLLYFYLFPKFLKEDNKFHWFILIFFFSFFVFYLHPDFKVIRILWAERNARFFLPFFLPLFLFTLKFESSLYKNYLYFSYFVNAFFCMFYGLSPLEYLILPCLFLIFFYFKRSKLVFVVLLIGVIFLKMEFRNYFIENSVVFHSTRNEWKNLIKFLDTPEKKKIAITSGPEKNLDNWFLFYVFGRNLQNEIIYVSPSNSGEIIDFDEKYSLKKSSNFEKWYYRLKQSKITHILSFPPKSIELEWMNSNPKLFKMLEGSKKEYGLFLLK